MSEYVSIYHKVKDLMKYFSETSIPEKEVYRSSLVKIEIKINKINK
jgi:hypothetical protein